MTLLIREAFTSPSLSPSPNLAESGIPVDMIRGGLLSSRAGLAASLSFSILLSRGNCPDVMLASPAPSSSLLVITAAAAASCPAAGVPAVIADDDGTVTPVTVDSEVLLLLPPPVLLSLLPSLTLLLPL